MNNSDTIIAYVTKPDKTIETHTFIKDNVNHQKELLMLLHGIANGMARNTRITFSTEV